MGMYDNIYCYYPLPDIDITNTGLSMADLQNGYYQTKDLDNTLDTYCIDLSGKLMIQKYNIDKVEESGNSPFGVRVVREDPYWSPVNGDYVIRFYDCWELNEQCNDVWVEWQAIIVAGIVQNIKLAKLELSPNAIRKADQARWKKELQLNNERQKKFWWKQYSKFILKPKRKICCCIGSMLLTVSDRISKIAWWFYRR